MAVVARASVPFDLKSASLSGLALVLRTPDLALLAQAMTERFGEASELFGFEAVAIDLASLPDEAELDRDARLLRRTRQGRAVFPLETRIVNDRGTVTTHDDRTAGLLLVQGPNVVQRYYRAECDAVDPDGFFDTGDIAVIDGQGFIRLVDRAKDVIKSGGEWISSIELENAARSHPLIKHAAVIAVPDNRWGERPLLIVEPEVGVPPSADAILDYLRSLVPRWWLPEKVMFLPIPLGATGKVDKVKLRLRIERTTVI